VAGVGDLLALFRCVSCRYRFSTDTSKPALMGAIGRVYASCEVRAAPRFRNCARARADWATACACAEAPAHAREVQRPI
jgi:hypothetical protein